MSRAEETALLALLQRHGYDHPVILHVEVASEGAGPAVLAWPLRDQVQRVSLTEDVLADVVSLARSLGLSRCATCGGTGEATCATCRGEGYVRGAVCGACILGRVACPCLRHRGVTAPAPAGA